MNDTEQLQLWKSDFGRAYTDRNDLARPPRIEGWREIMAGITPCRTLEVGCNAGWNMTYLRAIGWTELNGVEPQPYAVQRAREREPGATFWEGTAFALPFANNSFELVFTSGVLIHIATDQLGTALDEMYRVSSRYIVAVEYDAKIETEVLYRGKQHALWKRDHGRAWQTRFPTLKLVKRVELDAAYDFDGCVAHVFEK